MKEDVFTTLGHVQRLLGSPLLVKLGGAGLAGESIPPTLLEDIATLRSLGIRLLLVHGGGALINEELTRRGIQWEFFEGQRVTTPEMMEIIETVLFGTVNRRLVRELNLHGVPAVGLSGVEASTLFCTPAGPRLGQVGSIEEVDTSVIHSILSTQTRDGKGAIPVIAPIGTDGAGSTFNINADWAASRIAQALGIRKMIFLTDRDGILDGKEKVLSELDASELSHLVDTKIVQGGMLTKSRAVLDCLKKGVQAVHIINVNRPHALVEELFTDQGVGTIIRVRARVSQEGSL